MRTAGLRMLTGAALTLALFAATVLASPASRLPAAHAVPDPGGPPAAPSGGFGGPAAEGLVAMANAPDPGELRTARLLEDDGDAQAALVALAAPLDIRPAGIDGLAQASLLSIPEVVQAAYRNAARLAPRVVQGCTLDWAVLAGIGRVESRHGLFKGDDAVIDTRGDITDPIVGPALDGANGFASIPDSDEGRWDGDGRWDRAVGLMQFIPTSWQQFGRDGNADGSRDPNNVFDATLAAVDHLCSTAPGDLLKDGPLSQALFAYNRSNAYVAEVRRWIDVYRDADPFDLNAIPDELRRNPFSGFVTQITFDTVPGGRAARSGGAGSSSGQGGSGSLAPKTSGATTSSGPGAGGTSGSSPPNPGSSQSDPTPKPKPSGSESAPKPKPTPTPAASEPAPKPPPSEPAPTPPQPQPSESGSEPAPGGSEAPTPPEPVPSQQPSSPEPAPEPAPLPSPPPEPEAGPESEPAPAPPDVEPESEPAPSPDATASP